MKTQDYKKSIVTLFLVVNLTGCVSTIVGTAVDLTIEVAKVPFKVGGAVVDVVTDDDEDEEKEDS